MTILHLFSVNSALMDSKQRAVFSWANMIWFTSLKVACITMNQNLVFEGVPLDFCLFKVMWLNCAIPQVILMSINLENSGPSLGVHHFRIYPSHKDN